VSGFESLKVVERELFISNFDILQVFDAFHNLETVGDRFVLQNLGMEEMSGFENLKHVGSYFNISSCYNLKKLPTFPNLTSVKNSITLSALRSIETIDGFNSLAVFSDGASGEKFTCQYNENLKAITGFQNFRFDELSESFLISENPLLSMCNAVPICDYLDNGGMNGTFENNAVGCRTVDEVIESCRSVSTHESKSKRLRLSPNPVTDMLVSNLPLQQYQLLSIAGQVVVSYKADIPTDRIDVSSLPAGIYIAKLQQVDGSWHTEKLVVL